MKNKWKSKYPSKLRPQSINGKHMSNHQRCGGVSSSFQCNCSQHRHVEWGSVLTSDSDMLRIIALCCLAAFVLYINTIYADFAYDDSRAIVKNQDVKPETPLANIWYDDFWGTPLRHSGSHKSYRPLVVLTFRLNYALHQLSPGGYHLLNTLLHVVSTGLYTATVGLIVRRTLITLIAGLLFAIHPIHTEAVAGIVGRADVMCSIFFLLSMLTFMKYSEELSRPRKYLWIALTFLLVTASTLCKEIGITVLGVCAVYYIFFYSHLTLQDLKHYNSKKITPILETIALLALFGVILLSLRLYFMGYSPPSFSPADNPAADSTDLLTRTLTFLYLPVFNFYLLVCPVTLSFDWSMGAIPLLESFCDSRVFATIVFYFSLLWLIKYCLSYFYNSTSCQQDDLPHSNGFSHYKTDLYSHSDMNGHYTEKVVSSSNGGYSNGRSHLTTTKNGLHNHETMTHRKVRRDSSSSAESISCDENQNDIHIASASSNQHRHYATLIMALSMTILPFLPATNLFFYVGFVVAERVLYVPSMGFCLLVAEAVYQIYKKMKHDRCERMCLYIVMIFIALLLSLRCYVRCLDWRSEEQLYRSGISVNPAKAWGNLANILNNHGDPQGAEQAYRSALSHRGNMADVHYNLGILLQDQKRYHEALEEYDMAIKCRPRLTVAHLNRGIVFSLLGNYNDAIKAYNKCTQVDISGLKDPRMHETAKISALYNLGRLYAEKGEYQAAIASYNLALERRPEHYQPQSIYNLLGEAHFNNGNEREAERAYRKSLEAKPDHLPAHLTMAKFMNQKKRLAEAEDWYVRALRINDKDLQNYHHYAMFLSEHGRNGEALKLWQNAATLSPDNFDVMFNLASTYRQVGHNQEAVKYYEKATQLAPQSATAHMNLGAMYHINKNLAMAEKSYIRALELNPNDEVTKNNLQKLRNLMKKSKK